MATFISHSPSETEALGEEWGRTARAGLVIGLSGDLGAGKTRLVKGLARGIGSPAKVHSPTFTLLNEYAGGRLPFHHLDLYRLAGRDQVISAGLEEYFSPVGVTVVEWIERWQPVPLKPDTASQLKSPAPLFRLVQMEIVNETERRIVYEDTGD